MMLQRIENSVTRFARYFRLAIAITLILLVGVESAEFGLRISDTFHIGEIIIYFVLLGFLGLLVEVILQAHKKQQRSIDLLNYKHNMSLQLLSYQSWESLTGLIAKQLGELVDAKAAYLFLNQSMTGHLELIGGWVDERLDGEMPIQFECQVCSDANNPAMPHLHLLEFPAIGEVKNDLELYCYPVLYKNSVYAIFRFIPKPGQRLTKEQQEILSSISDEVIISLAAGQDRRRISELEHAKTALAERHSMSHYLHDNLGQNLGFLRMKLEQFLNDPDLPGREKDFRDDLRVMKDVADESYKFVRNKLEVTIPDSTPLLVNYLQEHAKKVAKRSNIVIQFTTHGTPRVVPLELQQACFFIFQDNKSPSLCVAM